VAPVLETSTRWATLSPVWDEEFDVKDLHPGSGRQKMPRGSTRVTHVIRIFRSHAREHKKLVYVDKRESSKSLPLSYTIHLVLTSLRICSLSVSVSLPASFASLPRLDTRQQWCASRRGTRTTSAAMIFLARFVLTLLSLGVAFGSALLCCVDRERERERERVVPRARIPKNG